MKIVYISTSKLPSRNANGVHVMKMCNALSSLGHDVTLLAPMFTNIDNDSDVFDFYGVDKNFSLVKLSFMEIRGIGLYTYSLKTLFTIAKIKPDLVYGRDLRGCFLSSFLKIPIAYESHQPFEKYNVIDRMLFRLLAKSKQLKAVIVISENLKKRYVKRKLVPKNKILTAHDASDVYDKTELPSKEKGCCKENNLRVGYIGHLYEGRGIGLLLECANRNKDIEFHFIGGSEDDIAKWKSRAKSDNVIFHGFIPPKNVNSYRNYCDILVAPYENTVTILGKGDTSSYMSPLKIFEYMSSGKAIIASDLPVLREVLTHMQTAVLVEPGNADMWDKAFNDLKNDQMRSVISVNAFNKFVSSHTWISRAKKIITFLLN